MTTSRQQPAAHAPASPLPVFDLGVSPYEPVQDLQSRLRVAVADGLIPGVLLLLEHDPVITMGSRSSTVELRDRSLIQLRGIDVVQSQRGGQATLHAPGQLVAYPIVPIPNRDLTAYVRDLEEVLRLLLMGFGVSTRRRQGRPGLYVGDAKIASIGLRCSRWITSHGTSLNVSLDLSLFELIVSCGEPGMRQTSLQRVTGLQVGMDQMKVAYLRTFGRVFDLDLAPMLTLQHDQLERALGLSRVLDADPPRP